VSSFIPGTYVGPRHIANGKATIAVNGPGVLSNGATVWSLVSVADADACTYPGSATWYVGPIENNPLQARLKKAVMVPNSGDRDPAGITSTAWNYGVAGGEVAGKCYVSIGSPNSWHNGSLIGVSQIGSAITIASFTFLGVDYSSPVDQITYILPTK
jgi:hypothetical protein